jgi:hypothetical protein
VGGFFVSIKTGLNIDYLCIIMTIDGAHKFINFLIRQSNSGVYLSPSEIDLILNRAQTQYFNKLYGNQNDYRYDRPVPKITYAVTEKISRSLAPFLSDPTALVIDSNGLVNTPTDLYQTVSITHTISGVDYEVTRVEHDRVANNLTSEIEAPDAKYPIYTQLRTKLQFYPKSLASATIIYLKKPTDVVWGYTIVNNVPVYDVSTSVQPEWADMDMNEVIYLALSYAGLNIKDGDVSQFANVKTQTGL